MEGSVSIIQYAASAHNGLTSVSIWRIFLILSVSTNLSPVSTYSCLVQIYIEKLGSRGHHSENIVFLFLRLSVPCSLLCNYIELSNLHVHSVCRGVFFLQNSIDLFLLKKFHN